MKKTWLLDPGHGGLDENKIYTTPAYKGKRSPVWDDGSQYYEGVGNRDIVRRIAEEAAERGIETEFIVLPNQSLDIPLDRRVRRANRLYYANPNAVYVSIHSNGFKKESAEGWEVWTSKGETSSDVLAAHLFTFAQKEWPDRKMRKDMVDGNPDKDANFYVLKNTRMPAVLSENFFHSNEYECREILMTTEGRQRIADMHLDWMEFVDKHETL